MKAWLLTAVRETWNYLCVALLILSFAFMFLEALTDLIEVK